MEEEGESCSAEGEGTRLIDLYRRYVMEESPQKQQQDSIDCYENNNILRYSNRLLNALDSPPADSRNYDFLEDAENAAKKRKVNKLPVKVLDAPALQDDY